MNEELRKARKRIIILFFFCLCIAFVCFGIFGYLVVNFRGAELENQDVVNISKIVVLTGIFFLVLAFGYLVPVMISQNKFNKGEIDMSDIFNEKVMLRALEKYIPDGETMLAGIHAVVKESHVTCAFGECILTEDSLLPDKNGEKVVISKTKHAVYDIYLGITQHFMVVADCEKNRYLYEFDDEVNDKGTNIQIVTEEILLTDVGKCFSLTDIENCKIKKGWMGSVKCTITMKNGNYFKLILPKLAGLGGGMPHHTEYRDAIIARLSH